MRRLKAILLIEGVGILVLLSGAILLSSAVRYLGSDTAARYIWAFEALTMAGWAIVIAGPFVYIAWDTRPKGPPSP